MESYLSKQVSKKDIGKISGLLGLIFIDGVFLEVTLEFVREQNPGSAAVGLVLLGLLLWPTVRVFLKWRRSILARKLNIRLLSIPSASVGLSQLDHVLDLKDAERKLTTLIEKGYLQYLVIDREKDRLVSTLPGKHIEKTLYVSISCRFCGAENVVEKGKVGKCPYCGQAIIGE